MLWEVDILDKIDFSQIFGKIKNMSITYQPKKRKRKKVHGFRKRSKEGKKILVRRRRKKRWKLTV